MTDSPTPPAPPAPLSYSDQLKQDYAAIIDKLELTDLQKDYLKQRWLDQVLWLEKRAGQMRDLHQRLRISAIVLGAIIPVLVTFNFDTKIDQVVKAVLATAGAGVTIVSALEGFGQYGNRWYSYRKSVELMKSHGWQFFEKTGSYQTYAHHTEALPVFINRIEEIIQQDVQVYTNEGLKSAQTHPPSQLAKEVEN
ncbi:MAG: DUF4231 domain-containing protein [Synechococcales bacterium]|nr:DUF4231 domain-containing protein [Synechococcales bacterium]